MSRSLMVPAARTPKIGIIIGSTRVVRVGPQVADFVLDTLRHHADKDIAFDRIDLLDHRLPMFDEPIIPQHIKSIDDYHNEHTKIWSRRIAALDAYVFVSAQRNWGIPAELKNAIDYLYHEWKGKPAMLVTYGGRGGVQCAEQLQTVLGSLGMHLSKTMVHMKFPNADFRTSAFKGESLGLDPGNENSPWAEHQSDMRKSYDEMVEQLVSENEKTNTES